MDLLWVEPAASGEKELPTSTKSDEELAKYTVDEHLSELERTVLFLNGGLGVQQRHAIANLPHIIKGRGRSAWENLAGPLKTALNRLDADAQVEAAEVFVQITRERLMSPADLQACLLSTVVRHINKEKSEEETEAWVSALCELIPVLDKETIKSQVMSMALSKGDMEDNASSRVICARILGACAPYLTKEEMERSFFKKAMAMCQDVDYNVRLSMCEQLPHIGRACGKDSALSDLLVELFELLKDEELKIRVAAFGALMSLLESIPLELRRLKVLPVVRQHLQPFSLDIVMQRCVASHFGVLMSGMKKEFEREDLMSLHSCYKHFASKSDTELRRCCASELVPMAKAACSLDPNAFTEHYSDTFQYLAMDADEQVRLSIATHLHEIARFVSKDCCCGVLTRPLVALLRDDSSVVQAAVLPMLNTTLHHLTTSADRRDHLVHEVLSALVDMEANCGRNWRIQVHLASSFPRFHEVFSSEQIHDHFLPMAFRFLSHSAAAVRPVAAEGIASFFRHCKGEHQRPEIFLRLVREFARGRSFTQRAAFGDVCFNVVKRFSSRFIKDWFFDLILDLLYDSVPNIRLQITRILPSLKQIIRLPEDVDLLERLNNAMSNAMTDNDRDVSLLARQVNDSYKRTPVRMGASMTNTLGSGAAAFETEDRRREEEELDFNMTPEETKEMKMEMIGAHKRMQPRASAPDGIRFPAPNKKVGIEMTRSGGLGLKAGAVGGLGTVMAGRNSKADEGGGGSARSGGHGSGSREGRNSYTGSGGGLTKESGDRNSGGGRTVGIGMLGGSTGDRNSGSSKTVGVGMQGAGGGDRNSGSGRTVGYGSGSSNSISSSSTAARAGGASTGRVGAGVGSSGRGASAAVQLPAVARTGVPSSSTSKTSGAAGQGSVMASRGKGSSSTSSMPSNKPTTGLPASSRNRGRS